MSTGGIDGFDWLHTFLPADSLPDHDPNSNNEGYQTHPAFHDAEEVARAAVMHQQAQTSYSFMRSTHPATNYALDPSQAYAQASGGQYGGNKHQQSSNIQFNHPTSGYSAYPTDQSHSMTHRPNPSVPSQQHSTHAHQDAYNHGQGLTGMDPAPYPWRTSNSTSSSSETYQSTHRAHETTGPTVPAHRTNQHMARAVPTSQNSYQGYSAPPNQKPQMFTQPHIVQGNTAQVQRTRTPAASQSPSYSHSTISSHNTQRPPHSTTAQGTQPTPPVQRTHSTVARPQASQRPYQSHSTTPAQNTQQLSVSAAAQRPWPGPPVQKTHTPETRPQASQSPYQSHSKISYQNARRSSHSDAPPSSHSSIDTDIYTPLVSPKGLKNSAARSTLEPRQSIAPATGTGGTSNPSTQGPATNSARSSPTPTGPSLNNQDQVPSAMPAAPDRVHSPAKSHPVSTRSPSGSFTPVSASAPPAPPAQTTIPPHHLNKDWSREKWGNQGKAAPNSFYQASTQTSQQPPISQPNGQSTPAVSSAFASFTPSAASDSGPAYNSSHNSGPRRGTFSDSSVAQQPVAGNTQSQGYPLPGQSHHQKKRWVPATENSNDYMPPTKMRQLDNGRSQTMTPPNYPSAGTSVPGSQVSMDYARPRGPAKILKNRDDLVQPIKQSDALPKHSYDPATIARDVLIAAGRHPREKHLNHHLEALRRNFTKIDNNADLATFRWDLVDAKQPETQVNRMPPVPAPYMPPPHPQPPQAARQSPSRDPASTPNHVITRDYAPMPSRDTPPNRQVAMPERIDARAPLGGLSPWGTLPFKSPTYHTSQHIFSSNLPSGLPRIDPVPASPKLSSHQSVPFSTPPAPQPKPQPQPQQRRPSTTNSVAPPKPSPANKQATPKFIAKPQPQGQTVKTQPNSGRTVKSPESRRLPQPQVVIPLSPAKMPAKKKPGRPFKNPTNTIEVAIHREQPVYYQIFPCKWEGCAAELHNIESVRAHLIKVHIPHSLVCKWNDCGNKTPMAAADMFTHLGSEHVSQMAWEFGDGPTVPVTAENQTNHPSVLGDRSARKGTMVLPVDELQVKAFSKAHGKSTEKTKAQALLEAGRHWKQQVGPEMDWSDRRLSTPARQSKFHCGEMAFVEEN